MRALGVWQDAADAVAPDAWVSARARPDAHAASAHADTHAAAHAAAHADAYADAHADAPPGAAGDDGPSRVATATSVGRLLVTEGVASPRAFSSMRAYDRTCARIQPR